MAMENPPFVDDVPSERKNIRFLRGFPEDGTSTLSSLTLSMGPYQLGERRQKGKTHFGR